MNADSIVTGKFASSSPESKPSISPEPMDSFGDSDCGEPLLTQRIAIDFSPLEEDNDLVQKKCVEFWDFVMRNVELKALETFPDCDMYDASSSRTSSALPVKSEFTEKVTVKEKTAVSMLELVEEKGLIDRAFEAKLPQSYCSLAFLEYSKDDSVPFVAQEKGIVLGIVCDASDEKSRRIKKRERRTSLATVQKLCRKLQTWDEDHPKYMEPPGHSQTLIYCKKPKNVS